MFVLTILEKIKEMRLRFSQEVYSLVNNGKLSRSDS